MSDLAAPVRNPLLVAVSAFDAVTRSRLVALVLESGHKVVEPSASPDAILTDGTAPPASTATVALGITDGEFAGVLPDEATAAQIDAALRAVALGLSVRVSSPQVRNFGPFPEEPPFPLTPREIEILVAIGNGLSNKAAARRLGISPHTVKFHIESVFRKLGAATRAEAVAKGLTRQIVEL